jgi:hypothetical protein
MLVHHPFTAPAEINANIRLFRNQPWLNEWHRTTDRDDHNQFLRQIASRPMYFASCYPLENIKRMTHLLRRPTVVVQGRFGAFSVSTKMGLVHPSVEGHSWPSLSITTTQKGGMASRWSTSLSS